MSVVKYLIILLLILSNQVIFQMLLNLVTHFTFLFSFQSR